MIPWGLIIEILAKLIGFGLAKAAEKDKAEKDLVEVLKSLETIKKKASEMRGNYSRARAEMKNKP